MAYPHYTYQLPLRLRVKEHTATPHTGYPRRGMQQPRITGRQLAPAELHVIHRLADKLVIRLRKVALDFILHGLGVQPLSLSQRKPARPRIRRGRLRSRYPAPQLPAAATEFLPLDTGQAVEYHAQSVQVGDHIHLFQQPDAVQRVEPVISELFQDRSDELRFCPFQG